MEPGFLITIEPSLTNGDASINGQFLELTSSSVQIDSIQLTVSGTQQILSLSYQGNPIASVDSVYLESLDCSNYVFGQLGEGRLVLTATNETTHQYDLNSPLIDLFREGDIVRGTMTADTGYNTDLFVFSINNIDIQYDNSGLTIILNLESLLGILSRSSSVQTQDDQKLDNQFLNPISSVELNFDNLLNKLLGETIITETWTDLKYYRGITNNIPELDAIGDQGSAINNNSQIYVFTPPTSSKLSVILQTLYAYQRVFYIDNSGTFTITPLCNYYNSANSWILQMTAGQGNLIRFTEGSGNQYPIQCERINIEKNSCNVQNRAFLSLISIFNQYNFSDTTGSNTKTGAYAIATIQSSLFPRLTEFVLSGKYLQTLFGLQELNQNVITNSGFLNIAKNFKNIQGLKSIISVNDNADSITSNSDNDSLKYFLRLYAAKNLAEQLFNDMHITVEIPTNLTYNSNIEAFRPLPMNEVVYLPVVNNNVFDGQQTAYCYGWSLRYNRGNGAMTTLHLTKEMTWTALWADSVEEIT